MKNEFRPLVYRGVVTKYYITENGAIYNRKFHKMKQFVGKKGYVKCGLYIKGKVKHIYVHVAVWESFMGPVPPHMEINHINANKEDNRLSQLELVTKQENMDHAKRLGLIPKGEECKRSKYKETTIREACELLEQRLPYRIVADITGLPLYIVVGLANKSCWKHIVSEYDIHNKGKHYYTPIEDAQLISLFESGLSYSTIAETMGLPLKSIKCRLFHLGYNRGINHIFTKEEEKELLELYNRGIPHKELAKRYGVSLKSIYGKIHRLKRK